MHKAYQTAEHYRYMCVTQIGMFLCPHPVYELSSTTDNLLVPVKGLVSHAIHRMCFIVVDYSAHLTWKTVGVLPDPFHTAGLWVRDYSPVSLTG